VVPALDVITGPVLLGDRLTKVGVGDNLVEIFGATLERGDQRLWAHERGVGLRILELDLLLGDLFAERRTHGAGAGLALDELGERALANGEAELGAFL